MIRYFILCSSVILVSLLTVQGYADEHFPFLAEVSKESVNVRAGSNTNFEKIDKLTRGARVVVLGRSYEWYKIQPLATSKSYIRSDYLKIKEGGIVGEVLGDKVNVRASPSSDAASLGQVKGGTLVKVIEETKGWCRVYPVAGLSAWVHQDFLKRVEAGVPPSMFIGPVQWPAVSGQTQGQGGVTPKTVAPVGGEVSLRGVVEPLEITPEAGVHYELMQNGKPVYYVLDMAQMAFFSHTLVDVKGSVESDRQKKLTYPLLRINKISLVL